jgi:hypothetical protein
MCDMGVAVDIVSAAPPHKVTAIMDGKSNPATALCRAAVRIAWRQIIRIRRRSGSPLVRRFTYDVIAV